MEENDNGTNPFIHEAEWQVVSLTASAYAAAPGPKPFDPPADSKEEVDQEEQAADAAMFVSDHFIFPPDVHKHLLQEPVCCEIEYEAGAVGVTVVDKKLAESVKLNDEDWKPKSDDGLHGNQFFDKGKNLDNEKKASEGFDCLAKEADIYADPTFNAFPAKLDAVQSVFCEEKFDNAESNELSYHSQEYLSDSTDTNLNEDNKFDAPGLPCEAWWKKHAMTVYNHAKGANTFWSVLVAAAVMGVAVMGQQWQKEKLQLKWFTVGDEFLVRMLGSINRVKDILVGGQQRSQMIRGGLTSN